MIAEGIEPPQIVIDRVGYYPQWAIIVQQDFPDIRELTYLRVAGDQRQIVHYKPVSEAIDINESRAHSNQDGNHPLANVLATASGVLPIWRHG